MKKLYDWRLQGQEKYLKGKNLFFIKYRIPNENWDHDHCEFCSKKFSEVESPGTATEGYTTKDHYRWICKTCFNDFKEQFDWTVDDKP